jgi:hypothetical protein
MVLCLTTIDSDLKHCILCKIGTEFNFQCISYWFIQLLSVVLADKQPQYSQYHFICDNHKTHIQAHFYIVYIQFCVMYWWDRVEIYVIRIYMKLAGSLVRGYSLNKVSIKDFRNIWHSNLLCNGYGV